jgi:hypothetical protein
MRIRLWEGVREGIVFVIKRYGASPVLEPAAWGELELTSYSNEPRLHRSTFQPMLWAIQDPSLWTLGGDRS